MKRADKRVRLNLTVTPAIRRLLESLAKDSEAETLTEVVRSSLRLYRMALDAQSEGTDLCIKDTDGTTKSIVIL